MRYFIKNYKKFYIPLVMIALFSILSYYMLFQSIIGTRNAIIESNEERSRMVRYQVEEYLDEKHRLLASIDEIISSMQMLGYNYNEIELIIKDMISNYKDINAISITDTYGNITRFITNKEEFNPSDYIGLNVSHREYFKGGRIGKKTTFKLVKDMISDKEILIISKPYYSKEGRFQGTITFSVNRNSLIQMLQKYNVDNKDYVVLLNQDSHILYHPKLQEARKSVSNSNFLDRVLREIKRENSGTIDLRSKLDEQYKVISYTPIRNTDWGVLSVKHISRVYTPLIKQFIINFNMMIVVGLLLYLILRTYLLEMKREEDFLIYNMERMDMLGQISAGIAHEIRNPLSSIKGYIQLEHLKNPTELSKISLIDLKRIEESLNQFLNLAKPLDSTNNEFYPSDIVKETQTILEAIGLLNDLNIEYEVEEIDFKIDFPKDYLRFIILNLIQKISNQLQKGETLRIVSQKGEKSIIYKIESDGIGKIKNDSLTLQTSKKIIESKGGKLYVDNKGYQKITIIIPYNK
ncbi:PAS domain-containing sensor histidine kinase [Alkalithermobacter paradoxus]|uniref:histidine kinase n=1 Tax=Alkalithermobacter paradoxus TaxID=29349 RepID=A0A1V4I518_9FIRM|nr:sporulation kinase A [[Clostridium] thermoalcaliphilum]